jgi:hypothetical protein
MVRLDIKVDPVTIVLRALLPRAQDVRTIGQVGKCERTALVATQLLAAAAVAVQRQAHAGHAARRPATQLALKSDSHPRQAERVAIRDVDHIPRSGVSDDERCGGSAGKGCDKEEKGEGGGGGAESHTVVMILLTLSKGGQMGAVRKKIAAPTSGTRMLRLTR